MRNNKWSVALASLRLCAVFIGSIALSGCGGGSGSPAISNQSVDATHGSLEFRLAFPKVSQKAALSRKAIGTVAKSRGINPNYDGSIPLGTHSLRITLSNPTTNILLATRTVSDTQRPDGVAGTIIVGFPLLPVGQVKVDVQAYPTLDATGNALANATTIDTITANRITSTQVLMVLRIESLVLLPKTQTIDTTGGSQSVVVNGQAQDISGNPLIYPLEYSSDQPQIADVTSVSPDFMHATVTAFIQLQTPTPVTITVLEPNSGATATATVIVGP